MDRYRVETKLVFFTTSDDAQSARERLEKVMKIYENKDLLKPWESLRTFENVKKHTKIERWDF